MTDSDLDVLAPPSQELVLAGKVLTITPLVVGELPAMLRTVQPFARELAGEPDWLALLGEHGESVLAALALGSRQSREWIDALPLDEALTLAAAVFEVNADFSIQRLAPKIGDLAQGLSGRLAGATPSPA
jgi:hypothetical protein